MSSPSSMLSRSVSGRHEELFQALRSFRALEALARRGWPRFILSLLLGMAAIRRASSLLSLAALNNFTRDKYDWRRELVVVTGGSGGLGDGLVRKLAKNCVKVISLDIVPPRDPLRESGPTFPCLLPHDPSLTTKAASNAYFYKTDIASSTSVKEAADQIRRDHGEPTVLVNNAAVMPIASILDETEEQIRRVFDVNIVASFLLIKEFIPSMVRNNHGHVVNIASMASFVTGANNVDYACSKAGTLALHEGLTQELRHRYKAPKVRTR